MIWLTWRQFRVQGWVTAAAVALFAIALAVIGVRLEHLYHASGLAGCHSGCGSLAASFMQSVNAMPDAKALGLTVGIMYLVPGILGVFWGAPLVAREIEAGTLRLAWTQSVTRGRWLAGKLGLTGLAAIATAGLLSLMVTWWASPLDRATGLAVGRNGASSVNRFSPAWFGAQGVVPIGYAAFAFALGAALGVLIRRTVPAMTATLAVFAGVQVTWPLLARPHLLAPLHTLTALNPALIFSMTTLQNGSLTLYPGVDRPGAWVMSSQVVDAAGRVFTGPAPPACVNGSPFRDCAAALGRLHLRQAVSYQPAGRYWAFQWMEMGIFLALALALAGFCFWWLGRRPA